MNIYRSLIILTLLGTQGLMAQSKIKYIHPEYKVRFQDSTGTYLQLINYYDRTYYDKQVYLKKILPDGSAQYQTIYIDKETGIGRIPEDICKEKVHLQIERTLEIENLEFKKNKLNRFEIRNEGGLVALSLKWGRAEYKQLTATFYNVYDSTRTKVEVPDKLELPKGKYLLELNTLPKIRKTVYLKPSQIFYFGIHRSIPIRLCNTKKYLDYKLYYSYYPSKKNGLCTAGTFNGDVLEIYLQPKKLYELHYRKKGRRRYQKKKFYLNPRMDLFIFKLK